MTGVTELTSAVFVLLVTVLLTVSFLKDYLKNRKFHIIERLPGDKRYPIFGTTLPILRLSREDFWTFLQGRHAKYGSIYRSWIGSVPWVHIFKADHIQAILKSDVNMGRGPILQKYMQPLVGDGLMFSVGNKWNFHRKMISTAFYVNMLDKYSKIFEKKGQQLAQILEKRLDTGYFEIGPYIRMAIIDAVTETIMGLPSNSLISEDFEYGKELDDFSELTIKRMYNPVYANDFLWSLTSLGKKYRTCLKNIWDYTRMATQKINEKFEHFSDEEKLKTLNSTEESLSFLDVLLANQHMNHFTEKEIIDEVTTFVSGAVDNISLSIIWSLFCLSNYPEVQKILHKEIDDILDKSECITNEQILQMEYLNRVIKETLRHYPTIIRSHRMLAEDIKLDGHLIPKGVTVIWSIYDLHHDPEQFPDPHKFDPDRFLPEEVAKRHPSSYAPFGIGVRNCLGQKFAVRCIKYMLANILRRYEVQCLETPETMKYYAEIVLKPQNGLHLKLSHRQKYCASECLSGLKAQ